MTRPSTLKGAQRRTVEYLWWVYASWLWWFPAGAVAAWVVITTLTIRWGELGGSIWEGAGLAWSRWILFVAGIVMATQSVSVLVAHGRTRRAVAAAMAVALALFSAVGAVIVTAMYGVEALVWNWQDAARTLEDRHLFDTPGQFWLVALESVIVYLAYAASGWFVGLGYYRFHALVGTLLLPVGLVPIIATELVLSSSMLPDGVELPLVDAPAAVAVVLSLLVTVAMAWAATQLQRTTPLRPRPR